MDFPVPLASANWQEGVPPEPYNQIIQRQRQWAIVQVEGFDPVIYVNCHEGNQTVAVLRKGLPNDYWQDAPVTGGSGGGSNHPNGVILLGPQGLAPFRDLLSTPPPPDNVLKPETVKKLTQGTLRLLPPTTYLKMCRVYQKKMNTNKVLKVVAPVDPTRPAQSIAEIFHYHGNQASNQAPALRQSPQTPLHPTPANNNAGPSPLPLIQPPPPSPDTAMHANHVTPASHFAGENAAADTANTHNAAAALNQMGAAGGKVHAAPSTNGPGPISDEVAPGGEVHAVPSTNGPRPISNECHRAPETSEDPNTKRQKMESRMQAVQGILQQKHQAWIKAAEDAAAAERRVAEAQLNGQEQAHQRELIEIRQHIQQLQAREQALETALGGVTKSRQHAEQLRAAEIAAERDLQSFFEVALGPTGRSQGQP